MDVKKLQYILENHITHLCNKMLDIYITDSKTK